MKFLLAILFIATLLRFYQLGSLPPSLTWDEVAWGYNAYSLGIDGKDEFGRFLPVDYLESFGDFKPPVYAYLDVLPLKLFGLNEFAVRFPSALFGVLTVLVTYFLTRSIFYQSKQKEAYALLTSFLLAISPWHVMLSRAAFEANIATFFLVTGVWLFLVAVQKKPWVLIFSAVSFILSIYTFNTARVVAPLLVILLTIGFHKQLFAMKKQVVAAALLGVLLLLPTLPFLVSPQASLRFKEVNIFSNIEIIERTNQEMANDNNAWWSSILHNRRLAYGVEFFNHYFDNLSPRFLFITGDGNPKFSTQSVGQLYLFELPFLIAGVLFLFRKREKNWWLIPAWLLLAIIPAATARETPHALRTETVLPMFQVLVSYGVVQLYLLSKSLRPQIIKRALILCSVLVVVYSVFYFIEDYLFHYAKQYSREWQYGYKNAVSYINEVEDRYDAIYLTKELGRPYAYLLFYKQLPPETLRTDATMVREAAGFVTVQRVGKYYFERQLLKKDKKQNILFIDSPFDIPKNAKIQKTFYYLDGETAMVGYTLD